MKLEVSPSNPINKLNSNLNNKYINCYFVLLMDKGDKNENKFPDQPQDLSLKAYKQSFQTCCA
jgi:hypothetical protein